MLKERHQVFVSLLVASDTLVVAAAQLTTLALAGSIGYLSDKAWITGSTIFPFLIGIPLIIFSFGAVGLYKPRRDRQFFTEFIAILKAAFFSWGLLVVSLQILKPSFYRDYDPAFLLTIYPALFITFLTLHRRIFRTILHYIRIRGWNQRHYAVIGTGRLGQIAFHTFLRNSWTGIDCSYFISHHDTTRRTDCLDRPVHAGMDDLEKTLEENPIDGVVVALPQSRAYLLPKIMMRLERFAVDVRIIPDVSPRYMPINLGVHELDGMPVLTMRQSPLLGYAAFYKRIIDVTIASIAILFFAIPMGIIAVLIKLQSAGPVVFKQTRVSVGTRPFAIYKFRTMRHFDSPPTGAVAKANANQGTNAWTKAGDPRITNLGQILRRTSLDELPQLFNVIRGNMSLVGPRPERLDLIDNFRKDWRGYMLRQNIKPGMTGWAQVNGLRGDTSLRKRLQYDLYYIRNWSLSFDLRILLLTVFKGFRNPNAR